jgi:uncharacterized Zn-finger protein
VKVACTGSDNENDNDNCSSFQTMFKERGIVLCLYCVYLI